MAKDVIIACDFPTRERTLAFLDMFGTERPYVKIGMELFYAEGPDIVREIKARGHSIFLDLKLCDIPNTVKRAMAVLRGTGADMINLHAFGTREMMTAALEGLTGPDGTRPLLIAVTQLTSTSEERMRRELLIDRPLAEVCLDYAENAKAAGLDGVVCSPLEAGAVHERCGADFLTVTPGVRFAGAEVLGAVSIFTNGMEKGKKRLAEAGVRAVSLTDFDEIVAVAEAEGYIPAQSVPGLMAFRADPSDESWMGGRK